jgi:hypothetical protein
MRSSRFYPGALRVMRPQFAAENQLYAIGHSRPLHVTKWGRNSQATRPTQAGRRRSRPKMRELSVDTTPSHMTIWNRAATSTVCAFYGQVTIHLGRSEALMTYCSLLLGALFRKTVYLDPLNDDVKLHV